MYSIITPELKIGAVLVEVANPIIVKRINILPLILKCIPIYKQIVLIVNKWVNLAPRMQIGAYFKDINYIFIGVKGIVLQ